MKPVLNIALHSCLSLSLKVLVDYRELSAPWRAPTATIQWERHYERTSPAMPFITCFCMRVCICAHIVCPCITMCASFSLCLYLSVYACMSVRGGRWQHTRCPLGRGSIVNISKQRTCWRALTLSTPLNSIPPSLRPLYACMLRICLSSAGQLQYSSALICQR